MSSRKKKSFILTQGKAKKNMFWSSCAMASLFLVATWQYWQYSGQSNQHKANFWDNQVNRSKLSQAFKDSLINPEAYFDGKDIDKAAPYVSVKPTSLQSENDVDSEESGNNNSVRTGISPRNSQGSYKSSNSQNSGLFGSAKGSKGSQPSYNGDASQTGQNSNTSLISQPSYNGYTPQTGQNSNFSDDSQPSYNGYASQTSQNSDPGDFGFKSNSKTAPSGFNSASASNGGYNLGTSRLRDISVDVKPSLISSSSTDNKKPRVTAQASSQTSSPWVNPYSSSSDSLTQTGGNSNSTPINVQSNSSTVGNNNSSVSLNQQSNRYLQNTYNYSYSGARTQNNSSSSYSYSYSKPGEKNNQPSANNYSAPQLFTPTTQKFNTGFSTNQQTPSVYTNPYSRIQQQNNFKNEFTGSNLK